MKGGFPRLVASSGLSNLADGVFQVLLPLVALGITRDPAAFATVTLVGRLPWLLFALPAGALADRLDRRRTMLLVNLGRSLLIGGLAAIVAADLETLWILYVLAFLLGTGETLFDTAAQSILPNVVDDPDRLAAANGRLYTVELTANQFVGPPLGGLLATALAAGLAASAGAYLLAGLALATLVGSFRPTRAEAARPSMRADIAEGLRYVLGHRVLRTMALVVGISNLTSTAMFAVFPLYAVDPGPMGLGSRGYGVLLTTGAVGAVLGSTAAAAIERLLGRWGALLAAVVLFPVTNFLTAASTSVWVVGAGFAVFGGSGAFWNVITVSLRQRITPDHLLGRMNAAYRLLAWGTMPLGALLGGVLAGAVDLRPTFVVTGVLTLLCVPLLLVEVTPARLAASEPEPTDA